MCGEWGEVVVIDHNGDDLRGKSELYVCLETRNLSMILTDWWMKSSIARQKGKGFPAPCLVYVPPFLRGTGGRRS